MVERLLALLDPIDHAIVDQHFFQGQPLKQVSEDLGLTYDQVRYRLHDILDRLADQLENWS